MQQVSRYNLPSAEARGIGRAPARPPASPLHVPRVSPRTVPCQPPARGPSLAPHVDRVWIGTTSLMNLDTEPRWITGDSSQSKGNGTPAHRRRDDQTREPGFYGCSRIVRQAAPGNRAPRTPRRGQAPAHARGGCRRSPEQVSRGRWKRWAANPGRGTLRTCRPVPRPRRGNEASSREPAARVRQPRPTAPASTGPTAWLSCSAFPASQSRARPPPGGSVIGPRLSPGRPPAARPHRRRAESV